MSLKEEQVAQLLVKKLSNSLSPQEASLLHEWISDSAENKATYEHLTSRSTLKSEVKAYSALKQSIEASGKELVFPISEKHPAPAHRVHFMKRWGWAAAGILVIGTTIAVAVSSDRQQGPSKKDFASSDIAPGGERAMLTLADGSTIILDSAANGRLAEQNGSQVIKQGGEIIYDKGINVGNAVMMNTMTTPKGGQYKLVLPDGSRVWLNAASSITFPAAFVGRDRTVTVTGEVYFEVAKNKSQPFVVNVNNESLVQVLGTSFNINSYRDGSAVTTTLLEGSIKVSQVTPGRSLTLRPGQQAVATAPGQPLNLRDNADIAKVMAWKNGLFNFEGVELQDMMRQFERWYDVTVVYEGGVPDVVFEGKMQRDLNLSEALEILKGAGINYRIEEGRKVIITP